MAQGNAAEDFLHGVLRKDTGAETTISELATVISLIQDSDTWNSFIWLGPHMGD